MSTFLRPTWLDISLDAMRHNIDAVKGRLRPGTRIMASVKANAYGHGAVEIARAAERFGVDYLGVAFLDEALQLRNAGIQTSILVLGYVAPEHLELARAHQITVALYRKDQLEAAKEMSLSSKQPNRLKVHIKLDTGMGRLGIIGHDAAIHFIEHALTIAALDVEGVFTHYSKADEANKSYTALQYERFHAVEQTIKAAGWNIPLIHAANSAGGMDSPQWTGDMVRLGIAMYGLYPSLEVDHEHIKLKPIMSLKSKLVHVKEAPVDWGISYGARYTTQKVERIGTIPIGYADGYSRLLSGKAEMLVCGHRVPVVGTICMDQCMVSLEGLEKFTAEELLEQEVIIVGAQGSEFITAEQVSDQLGTINYEFICMLADRIPRRYIEREQQVAVSNRLL